MRQYAGGGDHLHHRPARSRQRATDAPVATTGSRNRLSLRRSLAAAVLALVVAGSSACGYLNRLGGDDAWSTALDQSQQAVIAGRYDDADLILGRYADLHQGTPEAREAEYWRAVFKLDPANRSSSVSGAIASLDRYLAGPPTSPHWREAATLRRVAAQLETATRLAAAALTPTSAPRPVVVQDQAQADEIARLKAELAKANDELERIRKRLAQPRP